MKAILLYCVHHLRSAVGTGVDPHKQRWREDTLAMETQISVSVMWCQFRCLGEIKYRVRIWRVHLGEKKLQNQQQQQNPINEHLLLDLSLWNKSFMCGYSTEEQQTY